MTCGKGWLRKVVAVAAVTEILSFSVLPFHTHCTSKMRNEKSRIRNVKASIHNNNNSQRCLQQIIMKA
jgi:hypothetical protein